MRFLLATLFIFSSLYGAPQDEIEVIQELIQGTKKNLESQQHLLNLTLSFNNAREDFLENPDSARFASKLVKEAVQLQNHLVKEHLTHLFSAEFLEELAFYNQVGRQVVSKK